MQVLSSENAEGGYPHQGHRGLDLSRAAVSSHGQHTDTHTCELAFTPLGNMNPFSILTPLTLDYGRKLEYSLIRQSIMTTC